MDSTRVRGVLQSVGFTLFYVACHVYWLSLIRVPTIPAEPADQPIKCLIREYPWAMWVACSMILFSFVMIMASCMTIGSSKKMGKLLISGAVVELVFALGIYFVTGY